MSVTVNVLYTPGTNSHKETIWAFERVGAKAEVLMLNSVLKGERRLDDADILCIPGGFAYGDHTGAGNLPGQLIRHKCGSQLQAVMQKPIIAICNGFQIAVKSGLFGEGLALTVNDNGTFRNRIRQAHVVEQDTDCVWLQGLHGQTLHFPAAHGEGRFVYDDAIPKSWMKALHYPEGTNPDGSVEDIAGITSQNGLIFGLMDHPERLLNEPGTLDIFQNGVKAAS